MVVYSSYVGMPSGPSARWAGSSRTWESPGCGAHPRNLGCAEEVLEETSTSPRLRAGLFSTMCILAMSQINQC